MQNDNAKIGAVSTAGLTLGATLWPAQQNAALFRNVFLAVAGTMLLAMSAKLKVPFYPVPMTMQTFVVLVLGAAYGWRLGLATVSLYLFEGLALGMPVFSGATAGPAYLLSPTMGYLLSYLPGVALVGFLAERGFDRTPLKALAMMSAGAAINLFLGAAWLGVMIGFEKAVAVGVMPFLLADALKIALAASILPIAWKLVRR